MIRLLYDAGALIAAERKSVRMDALHRLALEAKLKPLVPVVVLAQAWRGKRQERLARLLKGCDILPDDEHTGRLAGQTCALAGTADPVDAIVVATAVRLGTRVFVVTSDPADLKHLADSLGAKLQMYVV